jgi:class 3 adenylate cyclase
MARNLLEPVAATLRLIAAAEQNSLGFYRSEQSSELLYQALVSAPQIDAVYASFDDGYHRVVTRMDADRRRTDSRIPPRANWHMSYIDAFGPGVKRERHRFFYESWPARIGEFSMDASAYDVRLLVPQYALARQNGGLAVTDPFINPDTGSPVIALGYPIRGDDKFVGVASAHITLDGLTDFLGAHRASANSLTIVADEYGFVLGHPTPGVTSHRVGGQLRLTSLAQLHDPRIDETVRLHTGELGNRFRFDLPSDGKEYIALFREFAPGPHKKWQVLVVTPTDDFVGELKRTNRLLIWAALVLILLESILIYFMARKISAPIEAVSAAIQRIRSLSFGADFPVDSPVREIFELQHATRLLENALGSFSRFAPVGIVRNLIESGRPLAPGIEQRFMTIFFSDIEGFTSIAERLSPHELSGQASRYFETLTSVIAQENGIVDKFIGDSVMAFWGAPAEVEDHVFRACRAAMRAQHGMKLLNAEWASEGRPKMRVRIGLHCDTVVVGNVGSSERLSYTVMGDGVNVASRLEGLNKQFGSSICISEDVYRQVEGRVATRPLGRIAVKGRKNEIMVYELLGTIGTGELQLEGKALGEIVAAPIL